MLAQTQQWFKEEKTQLFPDLWSHCCSSGIRAQPSICKWGQQPRAPVSSCYGIEARKTLEQHEAACWSPNGILLELGPEFRKPKTLRCTLPAACSPCERAPCPGSAVLPAAGKPHCVWGAMRGSDTAHSKARELFLQPWAITLNYFISSISAAPKLPGEEAWRRRIFYRVNKWGRQDYVSERPGCCIVFKHHFLRWLAELSADFP